MGCDCALALAGSIDALAFSALLLWPAEVRIDLDTDVIDEALTVANSTGLLAALMALMVEMRLGWAEVRLWSLRPQLSPSPR